MKTLTPLNSLRYFCANQICPADNCRCSLTYEPQMESMTLFIKFRRMGVLGPIGIVLIFAALLWWFGK